MVLSNLSSSDIFNSSESRAFSDVAKFAYSWINIHFYDNCSFIIYINIIYNCYTSSLR